MCEKIYQKDGDKMKKADVMQLIAACCLLAGVTINFLNDFVELPAIVDFSVLPLLLFSAVYNVIALVQLIGSKKNAKDNSQKEQ